jgi:hypothetical protein
MCGRECYLRLAYLVPRCSRRLDSRLCSTPPPPPALMQHYNHYLYIMCRRSFH